MLSAILPFSTPTTVVPVNRIFRPDAAGRPAKIAKRQSGVRAAAFAAAERRREGVLCVPLIQTAPNAIFSAYFSMT